MAISRMYPPELSNTEAFDERGHHAALALEEAARALDLEPWIVDRLRHPSETSTCYLQLISDSGTPLCVPFFQVKHNAMPGATVGSLSLVPSLRLADCEATAMERTWQAALLGLPLGGASYGLVCDPDALSERELMRLLRSAAGRMHPDGTGILLPGRNCARACMAVVFNALSPSSKMLPTGKPACMSGLDPAAFLAEGIAGMVLSILRARDIAPAAAKVLIHGYGAAGRAISDRLSAAGLTVTGLSDHSGAVYRSDGLILDDIHAQVAREDVLFGYPEAERISSGEMLKAEADVLVLASAANEINATNWRDVVPPVVIEAAWNAVSPRAREELAMGRRLLVPWCLATSGLVLGAYLESRGAPVFRSERKMLSLANSWVTRAVDRAVEYSTREQINLEQAASRMAINRVAEIIRSGGPEGLS